jgi:hypothetical protein
MVIDMNESKLATLEQIREFLARTSDVACAIPAEEPRLHAFVTKCCRDFLRFLFANDPVSMSESLGIVYRAIAAFQIKKARLTHSAYSVQSERRFHAIVNARWVFTMVSVTDVFQR